MARSPIVLTGDSKRDVPVLESRFGKDTMESEESARALAGIGDGAALAALVRMAEHRDEFMRRIAVEAISRHPEANRAVTTLLSRLRDDSPYVVRAACAAVARLGHAGAASRLRELTQDSEASTRSAAIEALGALQDPCDLERVRRLHDQDLDPRVRQTAASSLKRLLTAATWRAVFEDWSSSADPQRRLDACELARRHGDANDAARIEELTRDPEASVRVAAWRLLWQLRGASEWPATPLQPNHVRARTARIPVKNDGWTDLQYDLSDDSELNDRVSETLNVACHVFHHHAGGTWKTVDKEYYASLLVRELEANAWLTRILLDLGDRVVSMLVHRAVEMMKEDKEAPSAHAPARSDEA